ncbi:MAG: hypothetical protein JWN89_718 [Parcubacteria group bacterium]|nr:hypothetical protein [Parcubacteria group bacterium]
MDDPNKVTYFGETDSRNKRVAFGIKSKDRAKHMYVIGKTGMGKSTLLENLAIQDIQNGNGVAFIDPHGGTAEKLLEYIPQDRIKDVLYFAPFDLEHPVSFNVMEDVGADKRHLVVNGLMSTFEKIWVDAWSARMAYILNNTLLALLEFPGATLLGVNRMLADKEYRKKVVNNVKDPSVKAFWTEEFAGYTEKFAAEATPAIQNKVGQFTSNPLVRNLIGQSVSTFDIRKFMDEKKILIVNLSKGRVGEGNANLIGSMLITKIYLAAMSRADRSEAELSKLPNFYLYVDEFQSFANKSFADILSEARKYKLNLTIAHQYIEQMEEEVRDAVFGNVGTMIAFRVGAFDAEVLEKEFAPTFTAEDLVNLGFTQVYLKLMIDGVSSQPFSATTTAPIPRPPVSYKEEAIESSRAQYTKPRAEVEKNINDWHEEGKVERPARAPERSARPASESSPGRYERPERSSEAPARRSEPAPIDIRGRKPEREAPKQERRTPPPAGDDFKPLASISLADLNKKSDNQRQPSPKNISDLRSVLATIVKTPAEAKPAPHSAPNPQPQSTPAPKQDTPKEVPEAELKALLGVDE